LKRIKVETANTVIAVFADHYAADAAVKKLTTAGSEMKNRIAGIRIRGA